MKFAKAVICILVTAAMILLLEIRIGNAPPIGPFLNPSTGFWQNAESKTTLASEPSDIPGLYDKVIVRYDDNRIPHIFAKNDHDLYYTQGYVTARDRLWEMDIQTRSASGRLAEIVGSKAFDIDRYHRRMGMVYGAENTLKGLMKDPVSRLMVLAYTQGVNSYIHHLAPKDYPFEFKLLDYKPEDWKPINCALLLKLMSETLAGGSDQFAMTNNVKHLGREAVKELFPDYPFHADPIIPAGTQWNFKPMPLPKPSADFIALSTGNIKTSEITPGIGSNNWAISGSRSATGYPILANDPHLNLTFPSIWYQVQLSAPGVNVNGVSLPGTPCVIIGYNENVSWGVTNVDADVLDWYQIKFKDNKKKEYWYNNHWNKVSARVEVINVRGGRTVIDSVRYTHHGPVVYDSASQNSGGTHSSVPVGDALRWIAHDESNDFKCFYLLNRSKNYDDYRKALTYYAAPAQNFIFADNSKDIAITPNGRFPLKFKDQGKFILDGSDPANDWHGWIPAEQNPTVKNPSRGFVSSANQLPTDSSYPYYINWRFEQHYRGKRINDRLAAMHHATADTMRLMQMDNYSVLAQDVLPAMLKLIDTRHMDQNEVATLHLISCWDRHYDANSIGATIFDSWWSNFYKLMWRSRFKLKGVYLTPPSYEETERLLLTDPLSTWFDDPATLPIETAANVVTRSFNTAAWDLLRKKGKPGELWQWGRFKKTFINHLAGLPGFGTGKFITGGRGGVINALQENDGPSWRMVVQMGPQVKGYGVFPGGESGNPGSFYYDNMFNTWKDGKLNELLFLRSASDLSPRVKCTLSLTPAAKR